MARSNIHWATWAILSIGMALRVALAIVTPPELAYDDHFAPIKRIVEEGRLPRPDECWECYQPPFYYVVSAGVLGTTESLAKSGGATAAAAEATGRRAIQFLSVLAGCATLLVCRAIFRRVLQATPGVEALALAIIAVLPQHIYMSAMITNDAWTYLVASLAIWSAVRAHAADWHIGWCLVTGALGGAAVLSKAYGMVTAAIVVAATVFVGCQRLFATPANPELERKPSKRQLAQAARPAAEAVFWRAFRPAILVSVLALLIGVWPGVRNQALYQRFHVDNFDFFRTGMQSQPPGSVAGVEFFTFRLVSLIEYPWIHKTQLSSFWTELYARFWFDYEGFSLTLRRSPQWLARQTDIIREHGGWNRSAWTALLDWQTPDVPADFRRVAIGSYLAGLPLTALVVAGLPLALRRSQWKFGVLLLLAHLLSCLFVPLFQVLRLPYFAAMKAAFTLSALSSVPVLAGISLGALRGRLLQVVSVVGWLAVGGLVVANVGYIAAQAVR
jgi:hypothetical protein